MLIVKMCIKVNYITMFSKRGYIDSVISNGHQQYHDPRRVTLIVQMQRKYFKEASKYCTTIEIMEDLLIADIDECKEQIEQKKLEIDKLEKKLVHLTNYNI